MRKAIAEQNFFVHNAKDCAAADLGFMIQCDHEIENRKPDLVLIEKENKLCRTIDIACPADKVCDKEERKVNRYDRLACEVKQL